MTRKTKPAAVAKPVSAPGADLIAAPAVTVDAMPAPGATQVDAPHPAPEMAVAEQAAPAIAPAAPIPEAKPPVAVPMIAVVCHSAEGRRRVGRRWVAGETLIPVGDLSDYQLAQMCGDPLFTVVLPPALGA